MSDDNKSLSGGESRAFKFMGSGGGYFPIWLVNILLTIVTLGIYLPWALVRARNYFYRNTELAGERFSYHATGRDIFVGWLCLAIIYAVFVLNMVYGNGLLLLCMLLLAIAFFPWLITQGLRYQLQMTQLRGVRFNFNASPLRAWWAMLGCPLLMWLGVSLAIVLIATVSFGSGNVALIVIGSCLVLVGSLVGAALVQGVSAAKWYGLLVNNMQYGKLRLAGSFSVKQCTKIYLYAMLLLLPFIAIAMYMMAPLISQLARLGSMQDEGEMLLLMLSFYSMMMTSYLLYLLGMLVCFSFAYVKLRNYLYRNMSMEGGITFDSRASVPYFIWLVVSNMLVCCITLGLAWPWAKVRMTRYLMASTFVTGSLEALPQEDHNEQPGKDPARLLARGLSVLPFAL